MKSIKELEKKIRHSDSLYNSGIEGISDKEYDLLVRQLKELDPENELVTKINELQVDSEGKIKHLTPMLSLDKAYTLTEVEKWMKKVSRNDSELFLIQPKYDGISASYKDGHLATRGNGFIGEDITSKLKLIKFVTREENRDGIRGEIVISKTMFIDNFSNILKSDGKPYKNSRNAVAGIMGQKDIREIRRAMKKKGAYLEFVDWNYISKQGTAEELINNFSEITKEISACGYPLDGMVIKLKDKLYSESLGNTSHHPRGQIAFKFANESKESIITDIIWSHGKNCLTPVAEIEPIELSGVTISKVTLHNYRNIIENDVKIGDSVVVERAGEVIPYVTLYRPGDKRVDGTIVNCPCCGAKLDYRGVEIFCPNTDCEETKVKNLSASIKSIGIEYLGEPTVRKLMRVLGVESLKDIFSLTAKDLKTVPGFKNQSIENLLEQIDKSRKISDVELVASLNLTGISQTTAEKILQHYTIEELGECSIDDLVKIDGVGAERAEVVKKGFEDKKDEILDICSAIEVTITKGKKKSALPTICFTGKMPEKRSYYEQLAKDKGFAPTSMVTKDLALLITSDISRTSSKVNKAKKLKIKIMELEEWINM